jgi:hypothetical protein
MNWIVQFESSILALIHGGSIGMVIAILTVACLGFLALFWLTPLGVPALTRMGGGRISPDLRFGYGPGDLYALLECYGIGGVCCCST